MKSIIIPVRGDKTKSNIKLIAQFGFNITSPAEISVLIALYELYRDKTFILNEGVKGQIKGKIPAISEGTLKVNISRLLKSKAMVRTGKLIGLNVAFKGADNNEQIVLRVCE